MIPMNNLSSQRDIKSLLLTLLVTLLFQSISAQVGCPTFCTSNVNQTICSGQSLTLNLGGTNIPAGASIEWVAGATPTFDPYTTGTVVATLSAGAIPSRPPTPTGDVHINEIYYAASSGKFVELFNRGPGCMDIGCWVVVTKNSYLIVPAGTILCPGQYYVLNADGINLSANDYFSLLTNQLTRIETILYSGGNCSGSGENVTEPLPLNCGSIVTVSTCSSSATDDINGTPLGDPASGQSTGTTSNCTVWQNQAPSPGVANFAGACPVNPNVNNCAYQFVCQSGGTYVCDYQALPCGNCAMVSYTIPVNTPCNSVIYLKPRLTSVPAGCTGPTLANAIQLSIVCPVFTLTASEICASGAVSIGVTNGGSANSITGVLTNTTTGTTTNFTGTTSASGTATIPISGLAPGVYQVTSASVTNICPAILPANTVTVYQTPNITAINNNNTCPLETFDLTNVVVNDANGTSGTLTYYGSEMDAINMVNQLVSTVISSSGTYYIRKTTAQGCYDVTSVIISINNCTLCPSIGPAMAIPSMICIDQTFGISVTGLSNMAGDMSGAGNGEQNFGVQFVYFTSPAADPYVGGTVFGTVPFASLGSGGTTAIINGLSLPSAPQTYYIYVILSPKPTTIPDCATYSQTSVSAFNLPTVDAGLNQTICSSGTATLSGTIGGSATSATWTTSGNGTFNNNTALNAIYTPGSVDISTGSVILTLTTNDPTGPCPAVSDQITVTINRAATVNAVADFSVCQSIPPTAISLAGSTIGGGATTGTWSTASGGTLSLTTPTATPGTVTYTPNTGQTGDVTLTLTTNDPDGAGPCPVLTDNTIITIDPIAIVDAGPNLSYCQLDSPVPITLTGASITNGTTSGVWTILTGSGTLSNTGITSTPATVTFTPATGFSGTVTLVLTSIDPDGFGGPCSEVVDSRTISINELATVNAGTDITVCQNIPATPITLSGGVFGGSATSASWSIISGAGTLSTTALTATPATVTYTPAVGEFGTVTIRLTTNDPDGAGPCVSVSDDITLLINQRPLINAGTDITTCQTAPPTPITLSGATLSGSTSTGIWSIVSGLGTLSNTSATAAPDLVTYTPTATETGAVTLLLTSNDSDATGPCPIASDQIIININSQPIVDGGANITVCQTIPASSITLSGVTLGGSATTGAWSIASGSGTLSATAQTATPSSVTYTPGVNETGTITLVITTNDPDGAGPCAAASDVLNIVINPIAIVNAGDDITTCQTTPVSSITLSGATLSGSATTGTWSIVSGGGTLSNTAPTASPETVTYTPVSGFNGTIVLQLTSNDPDAAGPCTTIFDQRTIIINSEPVVNAGSDLLVCQEVIPAPISLNTSSISGGATMAAWSIVSGTGVLSNTGMTTTPNTVTYLPGAGEYGTITLLLTSNDADGSSGPCMVVTDMMQITINRRATVDAGLPITVCQAYPGSSISPITLSGGTVGGSATNGTWSIVSGLGTLSSTASTTTPNTITYTPALGEVGQITLQLTTNDPDGAGPCSAISDNLIININPTPIVNAGTDQVVCQLETPAPIGLSSALLSGAATQAIWTTSGAGTLSQAGYTATPQAVTYTPAVGEFGTITFTLTTSDTDGTGPCSVVSDQMTITINQRPLVNAGIDIGACQNSMPMALIFSTSTIGGSATTAQWTAVSAVTGTFSNAGFTATPNTVTYTPGPLEVGSLTFQLTTNDPDGAGPCAAVNDQVVILIDEEPMATIIAPTEMCSNDTANVSVTTTGAVVGGLWTTSGSGTFTTPTSVSTSYIPSATDIANASVNLTFTTNDPVGACPPAVATATIVIDNRPLPIVFAGADTAICPSELVNIYDLGGVITDNGSGITTGVWGVNPGSDGVLIGDVNYPSAGPLIYQHGPQDLINGYAIIYLESADPDPAGVCDPIRDFLVIYIDNVTAYACQGNLNISMDESCEIVLTPEMVLTNDVPSFLPYTVEACLLNGTPIGNVIGPEYIGQTLLIKVRSACTNNTCWGYIHIEDKIKPALNCMDVTVSCGADVTPGVGVPFPNDLILGTNVFAGSTPQSYTTTREVIDCDVTRLSYHDIMNEYDCATASSYLTIINRYWRAVDASGNVATCVQNIYVNRPSISLVNVPDDVTLACDGTWDTNNNGYPDTSETGEPSGELCNYIYFSYTDTQFPLCGDNFKVLRSWTIFDWCSGLIRSEDQLIKVMDAEGPTFDLNITQSVDVASCGKNVTICVTDIQDNCQTLEERPILSSQMNWTIDLGAVGSCAVQGVNYNEPVLSGVFGANYCKTVFLPIGNHHLDVSVRDECGNLREYNDGSGININVVDDVRPVPVCDEITQLTMSGCQATLIAASLDDGSTDNCRVQRFKAAKMQWLGGVSSSLDASSNLFVDEMQFDYNDFNFPNGNNNNCGEVTVVLRVFDCNYINDVLTPNNYNDCMVQVLLDDKMKPVIIAEPRTVYCDVPEAWNIPSLFNATWIDNCTVAHVDSSEITEVADPALAPCDKKYKRTYTATDACGNTRSATQFVTVLHRSDYEIEFPQDVMFECVNDSIFSSPTLENNGHGAGYPHVLESDCEHVGISYTDQVFEQSEDACYKIVRKWKVYNWCVFNVQYPTTNDNITLGSYYSSVRNSNIPNIFRDGGDGYMEYTQIIKVKDQVPPSFVTKTATGSMSGDGTLAAPFVFNVDHLSCNLTNTVLNCTGTANISVTAEDECTNNQNMHFHWKLDLYSNGTIDQTSVTNVSSAQLLLSNLPIGDHKVTFYVQDACGNYESCDVYFRIRDKKKPTPVCIGH